MLTYLQLRPNDIKASVSRVLSIIKKKGQLKNKLEFTHIVVSGYSGLLIGVIIAQKLKKELVIVRKNKSNSHGHKIEYVKSPQKYIIIDDFICEGKTIRRIKKAMSTINNDAKCTGIILYNVGERYMCCLNLQKFTKQFGTKVWK